MYRGVSIPAWTVLREPSEASGAPSEDELESRLSSEMVDEIAPTPQPPARRPPSQTQRPNMVTPSSQSAQRPAFVEGSSTGSQASSSSVPRNPPSPLFTRRPLSDSGSDGEPRPPKKKKKRILNPEQGPATARTRVPLDGQPPADDTPPIRLSQLASNMFPPTLKSSEALREARRKRRVTMDVGILAHQSSQPSGSQAERRHARRSDATGTLPASQKSIPSLPRSNANTPLQQAQARRKSTNARGRDGHPSTGQRAPGPSSQRPPPTSAAPPSPEVIEILDSDDEPPPPPPRKAPAKPPAPPPPLNIPRRTKYQPNPLPQYKEENGVIILTSDDDESAAPPKSKTPAPSTPSIPEKGSQEAEVQNRAQVSSQRPAATSPLRASENPGDRNPQSAVSLQMATEDEVAARVTPPPADMLDVEMTEEDPALPEMSEEIPEEIPANADPSVADAQLMDDMAAPQESPPGDPPDPSSVVTQEDPPSSGMVPPDPPEGHAEEDVDTRASPPVDEPPVRTSLSVEPPAATEVLANPDPIQRTSPPLLPTQGSDGTSPADQGLPEKLPPLSGPVPPSPPDQVPVPSISSLAIASRSETASPVSSMLDPQLQELAISGTPTGNDQSAHQTPSSSVQQSVPSKPPSSSSSSSSTAWSSSSSSQSSRKAPKIRIKAALYSGPDGFFADVYRHSQKRRQSQTPSSSQSRPAASPSTSLLAFARDSSRVAATISPEAVKLTDTNSPPALQESSVMSKQQPAIPVEVQEEPQLSAVEERNEVPGLVMQAEMTGSLLTKPSLEEPCQLVTSSQVVEEPQNASLHEDQPMEEDGALAPASPTGIRASPPEQQGPTAAFEPVQPETPSDHRPAQPQPSSNAAAVEDPRIAEECGEARALQVSLPSSGINTARGDTPPVENQPDNDPRTLSQIILKAVSEKARQDIVDLTLEDSDNDAAQGDKPGMSELSAISGTATTIVAPVTPSASPASERVKTVDLSVFRNMRKGQRRHPQLTPTKPGEKTSLPLPRNLGRIGGLNKPSDATPETPSSSIQPVTEPSSVSTHAAAPAPVQADAMVGSSQNDSTPSASTAPLPSPPLSQPQQKPMLPRIRDLMRIAQQAKAQSLRTPPSTVSGPADSVQPIPAITGIGSVEACAPSPSPSDAQDVPSPAGPSEVADVVASAPSDMVDEEPTPPRSPSPETMEEEECLSLIYPDSAERTPEVEMFVEAEQERAPVTRNGHQTRSQAASDASSVASGPRRSARLTSSSASSSAEPPERPVGRSRRYQPYVRTHSDEVVAAQGGIACRQGHSFLQAFASAGFEAISWKEDRRRIAKEFAPVTQLAKDIPHDLHDRLNALPLAARQAGNMQLLVFEAEIRANTAADEPDAPPVYIVNDVDDEPTPPLEFYYSNLMWHGEGVPKPDHENLRGCDCVGPCDPMSKTCACVKRQAKYWDGNGFIYDRKGKLKDHEYPIFECNMNCGCSEDCPNRVVQNGRQSDVFIAICKTVNKGWGVFAGHKKIPANTYIGIYAGEYLTDSEGEIRGTIYNKFGRTYLFDLDFWFLNEGDRERTVKYCIDAYHAGNFTRYLNHSCDPNCVINACYINEANMDKPLLAIFTCRDVEPYEELCFSYFGQPDDDMGIDAPPDKDDAVYVTCQCGAANCRGTMWK